MKSHFLNQTLTYDGAQLRSGWIESACGLSGDAIISFVGAADVPIEHMVDLEDVARNDLIYSEEMLHFMIEMQGTDLETMVWRQRFLITIIKDILCQNPRCANLTRKGDDLYEGDRKLSVSIATRSPKSCLIHTALNVSSKNTPVKTIGLSDYKIAPQPIALQIMEAFVTEHAEILHATQKVRSVV